MQERKYELDLYGKKMVATFSDLAMQANGSVMLSCENTVVFASAVIGKSAERSMGYFNLTVEYVERYYAVGKILGGQYMKREGRPSDKAILNSRLIDRTIRPLFPQHIKNAVQVIVTVLSVGDFDPGILAMNAVSLAIGTSDIPWAGPVGCVHVGKRKGEADAPFAINNFIPSLGEPVYDFDLVVCGKEGTINMIEAMTYEYDENKVSEAFDRACEAIKVIEDFQKDIIKKEGKTKLVFEQKVLPEEVKALFAETVQSDLEKNLFGDHSKQVVVDAENIWKDRLKEKYPDDEDTQGLAKDYFHHFCDELLHKGGLVDNRRIDLRDFKKVRPLFARAGGVSGLVHGSGTFYRGETHIISMLTLGGTGDVTVIDGMEIRGEKRFTHHYNFPPYSAGETGRTGGINRREMGHGFLAEKALWPVIPASVDFPYTIRLVSETFSSNGSTSQASICASSIALMDGGVPIKYPVAGIAMGLISDEKNPDNYRILTDIQGAEDHFGDMDFKVAGTRNGVTAIQLDIKVDGINPKILKEALIDAKAARVTILDTIETEIKQPRKDIHPLAPRIDTIQVKVDQIGLVIGGGGKTVNEIRLRTGTEIDIKDDGLVYVSGPKDGVDQAIKDIEALTHEWKIGEEAEGVVTKVADFGAFVAINNTMEGMVHVSEIAPFRVEKPSDFLKAGDKVPVKVVKVQDDGKIGLSIKARDPKFFDKK